MKDWVGHWFEYVAESGEDADIVLMRFAHEGAEPQVIRWPHAEADGITGITRMLRASGTLTREMMPPASPRKKPARHTRALAFLKSLSTISPRSRFWRDFDHKYDPVSRMSPKHAQILFSREETKAISFRAKSIGVSMNSLLLEAINSAVSPYLEEGASR